MHAAPRGRRRSARRRRPAAPAPGLRLAAAAGTLRHRRLQRRPAAGTGAATTTSTWSLAQDTSATPGCAGNFPQRSVDWFDAACARSSTASSTSSAIRTFHPHMFDLLERHPGVVVLHDFFLSGVVNYAEAGSRYPNHYCRTLYQAHGYRALIEEQRRRARRVLYRYPCNKPVLDHASRRDRPLGAFGRAGAAAGTAPAARQRLAHAAAAARRCPARSTGRRAARARHRRRRLPGVLVRHARRRPSATTSIVEAWLASALAHDPRCHLVFVGETNARRSASSWRARIAAHPRIRITGYRRRTSCTAPTWPRPTPPSSCARLARRNLGRACSIAWPTACRPSSTPTARRPKCRPTSACGWTRVHAARCARR